MNPANCVAIWIFVLWCQLAVGGEFETTDHDITSHLPVLVAHGRVRVSETTKNAVPVSSIVYYEPLGDSAQFKKIVLTESIAGISYFLRTEFPGGVTEDIAGRVLPPLLCDLFATETSSGLWAPEALKNYSDTARNLSHRLNTHQLAFVLRLGAKPQLVFRNGEWRLLYTTFSKDGSIGRRFYQGKLRPFCIETRIDRTIAPPGFSFEHGQVASAVDSMITEAEVLESSVGWMEEANPTSQ